jgi:hypothetical protein
MNHPLTTLIMIATLTTSCSTSKFPRERHVTINTKINFKRDSEGDYKAYYTLDVDRGGEEHSVYWPANAPQPHSIAKNRSYTVELLEVEHRTPINGDKSTYWAQEMFRLSNGERLLYDASVCPVHRVAMERKLVPISYGIPMSSRENLRAQENQFPYSGVAFRGCSVIQGEPSTRDWVCPACVAHKKQWEQQNQTKTGGEQNAVADRHQHHKLEPTASPTAPAAGLDVRQKNTRIGYLNDPL